MFVGIISREIIVKLCVGGTQRDRQHSGTHLNLLCSWAASPGASTVTCDNGGQVLIRKNLILFYFIFDFLQAFPLSWLWYHLPSGTLETISRVVSSCFWRFLRDREGPELWQKTSTAPTGKQEMKNWEITVWQINFSFCTDTETKEWNHL